MVLQLQSVYPEAHSDLSLIMWLNSGCFAGRAADSQRCYQSFHSRSLFVKSSCTGILLFGRVALLALDLGLLDWLHMVAWTRDAFGYFWPFSVAFERRCFTFFTSICQWEIDDFLHEPDLCCISAALGGGLGPSRSLAAPHWCWTSHGFDHLLTAQGCVGRMHTFQKCQPDCWIPGASGPTSSCVCGDRSFARSCYAAWNRCGCHASDDGEFWQYKLSFSRTTWGRLCCTCSTVSVVPSPSRLGLCCTAPGDACARGSVQPGQGVAKRRSGRCTPTSCPNDGDGDFAEGLPLADPALRS